MRINSKSDNDKFTLFPDGTLHLYDNLHEVQHEEHSEYEGELYITHTALTQAEVEEQFDYLLAVEKAKWAVVVAHMVREERNRRIAFADILVNKAADKGVGEAEARAYRQALRDVPTQVGFPMDVQWPKMP